MKITTGIDIQSTAAKSFYKTIRGFADSCKKRPWQTANYYQTLPDEMYDLTLVSLRVYGRRDEFLAVMAAAGLNAPAQPLVSQLLALPTEGQLYDFKRQTGFESQAAYRDGFKPVWA